MSITVNNAICLHAQAGDLKFLNPVRNRMNKLLGESFRGFSLGSPESVVEARLGLEKSDHALVVIFAHGGRDYVRGGEYVHRVTREIIETQKFLTTQDVRAFAGNVIFCLSCDSNGLARASMEAGAIGFVGFDDIPFNRYDLAGDLITNHEFEHHAQQLLASAIKAALERFLTGQVTLHSAVEFLRLWICHDAVRFVRKMSSFKQRREAAALLLRVKDGVRYHGSDVAFAK